MWWKNAKAGDKVVCIDDQGRGPKLTINRVYVIRDLFWSEWFKHIDCQVYFDVGVPGPDRKVWWYNALLFRPVEPKSTEAGMRILRGILSGQRESA